MKRIVLLCIVVFMTHLAISQDVPEKSKKHKIGLFTGMNYYVVKDVAESPLTYQGGQVPVSIKYQYYNRKNYHTARTYLSQSQLKPGAIGKEDMNGVRKIAFDFSYAYYRSVKYSSKKDINILVGPVWQNFASVRIHHYGQDRFGHELGVYYEFISRISLGVLFEKKVADQHQFRFGAELPVITYLSRPMYTFAIPPGTSANYNELNLWDYITSGSFDSSFKFTGFTSTSNYAYKLSGKWELEAGYAFMFYQYANPLMVKLAHHQLLLGANFNF